MKCPKCGYLGFETVDRCRNCGYDFSMAGDAVPRATPTSFDEVVDDALEDDLALRNTPAASDALHDLDLGEETAHRMTPDLPVMASAGKPSLDLDRLIGLPEAAPPADEPPLRPLRTPTPTSIPRPRASAAEHTPLLDAVEAEQDVPNLPLFGRAPAEDAVEPAYVAPPRPAGPPLAVRRGTPEVTRPRNRPPRTTRSQEPPLSFGGDAPPTARSSREEESAVAVDVDAPFQAAALVPRVAAALIDTVLLGAICGGVLYLTLRFLELTFADVRELPLVPMGAFLVLIVIGYLIAFTAAGGQTIGKMATGIKVVSDDGRPVDVSAAALRTAGTAVNLVTLGLAWLPALFAADGRSLADRLAGTRVVRA